jgi:hypothetical protein
VFTLFQCNHVMGVEGYAECAAGGAAHWAVLR